MSKICTNDTPMPMASRRTGNRLAEGGSRGERPREELLLVKLGALPVSKDGSATGAVFATVGDFDPATDSPCRSAVKSSWLVVARASYSH